MFVLITQIAVLVTLPLVKRYVGSGHYLIASFPYYGVDRGKAFPTAVVSEVNTPHKHLTGVVVYGWYHHQLGCRAYGTVAVKIFLYVHHLLSAKEWQPQEVVFLGTIDVYLVLGKVAQFLISYCPVFRLRSVKVL